MTSGRPCLSVCITCGVDGEAKGPDLATRPGRQLLEALRPLISEEIELRPVICLANCEQGCSAAVQAPGKWSYLLGHLTPDQAADVARYASLYAKSQTGFVSRNVRAESLREALIARMPAYPPDASSKVDLP